MKNISRMEELLSDPMAGVTLNQLRDELNELAKIRDKARLQFCKRLALVYVMLIGRRMIKGPKSRDDGTNKFLHWCTDNIHSRNGKKYSRSTLLAYLTVGFSSSPEKCLETKDKASHSWARQAEKISVSIKHACTQTPKAPISVKKLKTNYQMSSSVAQEVNSLMTIWEKASSQARSQFIYFITGRKI